MNLNEAVLNRGKGNKNKPLAFKPCSMPPPSKPAPKKRGSSIASTLPWGRSRESILNSSSVLRSGSSSKTTTSSEHETRIILALTGGRGQACFEVGLAVLDISRSNLILCQISDTPSYNNTLTKINIFDPDEILIPSTFVNVTVKNRLIELVREKFSNKKFISVARSAFNKLSGFERLQKLCLPSFNSILLSIQHKYYALSAASATLSYAQTGLYVFYCSESIKVEYQESEGFSVIDICTADRLELVASTRPEQANKYSTLYGVVNYCITKIGSRTLRSAILQPPYNVDYINERIECVAELVNNPKLLTTIQTFLPKLASIDQLLQLPTLLPGDPEHLSIRQLNYLLLLNNLLDVARPLGTALGSANHPILAEARATLCDERLSALGDRLQKIMHEEARYASGTSGVAQRCFLIKPGINGLLDMVRRIYSERIDEMREYVKSLEQKHNLPLTLGNNSTKGYHIVLSLKGRNKYCFKKSEIPEEFIQVYRLAGSFTMKTLELLNLSTRIEDLMTDIIKISNVMIYKLLEDIKPYLDLFYQLVESVARLDMFQSLAQASVAANYVKPEFNNDFTEVKFSHHPMLDFLCASRPVPNSYFACKDHNFHIITGPNGSGKSIFIRQVILLQVMAQIGCFIPAKSAVFRPADRIFARVYMEDDMECGVSTFTLEVKEINHIMTAMTDNSLIVMDEPCRSTNINQGAALAMAVCEKLANSSAFIFVTTHFLVLAKLQDLYLNVKVWQMETIASGDTPEEMELDFKYTIVPGVTGLKDYGIYLVRNIWPASMLEDIDEMGKIFKLTSKNVDVSSIDPQTRILYEFKAELNMLQLKRKLTKTNINNCVNKYQNSLYNLGYNLQEIVNFVNTFLHLDLVCDNIDLNEPREHTQQLDSSDITEDQIYANMGTSNLQENEFQFGIANQTVPRFGNMDSSQLEGDKLQFGNSDVTELDSTNLQEFGRFTGELQEFGNMNLSDIREQDEMECQMRNIDDYGAYEYDENYPQDVSNNSFNSDLVMDEIFQGRNSSFQKLSDFLNEAPDNVTKLIPEISLSYPDSVCSKNGSYISHNEKQTASLQLGNTVTRSNINECLFSSYLDSKNNFFSNEVASPIFPHQEKNPHNFTVSSGNLYKTSLSQVSKQFSCKSHYSPNKNKSVNIHDTVDNLNFNLTPTSRDSSNKYYSANSGSANGNSPSSELEKRMAEELEALEDFSRMSESFLETEIESVIESPLISVKDSSPVKKRSFCNDEMTCRDEINLPCNRKSKSLIIKEDGLVPIVPQNSSRNDNEALCNDQMNYYSINEKESTEPGIIANDDKGMNDIGSDRLIIASPCNLENNHLNLSRNSEKQHEVFSSVANINENPVQDNLAEKEYSFIEKSQNNSNKYKEKHIMHIFPIVIIREGPNNKSISFGTEGDDGDNLYLNIAENVGEDTAVKKSVQSLIKEPLLISQKETDQSKKIGQEVVEKVSEMEIMDNDDERSQDLFQEVDDDETTCSNLDQDKMEVTTGGVHTIPKELPIWTVSQKSQDETNNLTVEDDKEENVKELNNNKDNTKSVRVSGTGNVSRSSGSKDISEISKERNLSISPPSDETKIEEVSKLSFDVSKSKTTSKSDEKSKDASLDGSDISVEELTNSRRLKKTIKRKFKPPLLNQDTSNSTSTGERKVKRPRLQSKFKPPRPLTKREIVEEFNKQDQQFIEETTVNPSESHKYLERLLNRPSVQQMRNAQHIALLRKTQAGVVVIPAEEKKRKHGKPLPLVKRFVENVDLTIFSDENAKIFDQFAKSAEKDYNKFKLTRLASDESLLSTRSGTQKSMLMFPDNFRDFGPSLFEKQSTAGSAFDYFSRESCGSDFVALKTSGNQKFTMPSFCGSDNRDIELSGTYISLTPNGFYKENKNDIEGIIGKYNS